MVKAEEVQAEILEVARLEPTQAGLRGSVKSEEQALQAVKEEPMIDDEEGSH
jgi:hypothetical protein